MFDHAELERLKKGELGPALPAAKWGFALDLGANPEETWNRIVGVVGAIVEQDPSRWPDDEYWSEVLPSWLLSFMMTGEESDAAMARTPREQWGQLPWEFGSWLDAIRERDWHWWGGERSAGNGAIVLEVTGIPPRIDAFKQILLAAGAQVLSERHD
jgi:hypothetical protein